ncbi:hypothetical protein Tsp_13186 [Trichinella spiralis]|uniref:hypothetical protein n=1 Tax=Trichinella spiralis TaxID=6334 RepID=UPI0001EFE238|nr:hypothetical protein Tsp_13186 [Trichinella spiralis]
MFILNFAHLSGFIATTVHMIANVLSHKHCSASLFLFGGLVMFYEGSAEISNQITFQNNFVININRVTSSFWLAFAGFMLFAVCLTLHMVNSVLLCFCCPQLEKYKQMQQTDDTPSKDYPGLFFGGTIL